VGLIHELTFGGERRAGQAGGRPMDDQHCDKREVFGMHALLRAVLLVALAAGSLLLAATPGATSAKDQFACFAEAFSISKSTPRALKPA
jgi:hypothetical protein